MDADQELGYYHTATLMTPLGLPESKSGNILQHTLFAMRAGFAISCYGFSAHHDAA